MGRERGGGGGGWLWWEGVCMCDPHTEVVNLKAKIARLHF